tara:strand:- start:1170 stop:1535 length:366 start_codon:yes stop_codon:yes gene_type:complete
MHKVAIYHDAVAFSPLHDKVMCKQRGSAFAVSRGFLRDAVDDGRAVVPVQVPCGVAGRQHEIGAGGGRKDNGSIQVRRGRQTQGGKSRERKSQKKPLRVRLWNEKQAFRFLARGSSHDCFA